LLRDILEVEELAVVTGVRFFPQGLHDLDRLLGGLGTAREGSTEGCELCRPVPDADAEDEATARQHVKGGGLFGYQDGGRGTAVQRRRCPS
jgi:hypothetical protein